MIDHSSGYPRERHVYDLMCYSGLICPIHVLNDKFDTTYMIFEFLSLDLKHPLFPLKFHEQHWNNILNSSVPYHPRAYVF